MKRLIVALMLALSLLAGVSFADPVSIDTAEQVAENWMNEIKADYYEVRTIIETFTETEGETETYYIFNFHPEGWVIVSADDIAYPVIGYSETNTYSEENRAPQFNDWMNNVKQDIRNASKRRSKALSETREAWERLKSGNLHTKERKSYSAISPLIKTTWNQDSYYNELCPTDSRGPGGHVYAGCVATAMAQVMKYHNSPAQGTGSHGYYASGYGYLSANFGTTTYSWGNMPNSIGYRSSQTQINAVAKLIYHCGVAVDMIYGPDGSGAYMDKASRALENYFGYDKSLYLASKSAYSDTTWKNLLVTEINAGRPVLYAGSGTGGHAFVCDGYQNTNYFHFNWGWGGSGDGYFYLNRLTPGDGNFSNYQEAIFGIKPTGGVTPSKTGTIYGYVKESGSSQKISGASVIIGGKSASTNSNGYFSVTNVPAGSQTLKISKTGYENVSKTITIRADQSVSAGTIYMTSAIKTGTVYGYVKESGSSQKISGANVTIGGKSSSTNSNGYFSVVNVPAGSQTLKISKTGYSDASTSVLIVSGKSSYAGTIYLKKNSPISSTGTVWGYVEEYDTYKTIDGAKVTIGGKTVSASYGFFSITDVPIGYQILKVSKTGYEDASQKIMVEAGEWNYVEIYLKKNSPAPTSDIRVISPNGGESLKRGGTYTIQWKGSTSGWFDWIMIYLYKNGYNYQTIGFTDNTGSYRWTIPWWITSGSNYQIVVQDIYDPNNSDYSDRYFSIE